MSPKPDSPDAGRRDWLDWLDERLHVTELFSFLSHFGLVYTPVDSTRPIREVLDEAATRPVSSYLRWPQVLGLLTTVLFGVLAATGVLLAFVHTPSPERAYATTRTIVRDLPFGWLIHQVHAWGARALIVVVAVRLGRFFLDGLYRAPRELLWWSAVATAWIVVQLDFTGRLLAWDQAGYWDVQRGIEIVAALPLVGPALTFVGGGKAVDGVVLLRFHLLHTLLLPLLFLALFFLTFATLRRVGLTAPARGGDRRATGRDHWAAIATLFLATFGALAVLAVAAPIPFGREADPFATPAAVRAPWYLLPLEFVRDRAPWAWWPASSAFVVVTLAALFLPAWAGRVRERVLRAAVLAGAGLWLAIGIAAYVLERGR